MNEKDRTGYWNDAKRSAFGKRLREARAAKQLSLEQVAIALGSAGRARIGHWETGERVPDAASLAQLCELLDVSADRLLFGAEPWLFPRIDANAIKKLEREDRLRLEGALLLTAAQLGLKVERPE